MDGRGKKKVQDGFDLDNLEQVDRKNDERKRATNNGNWTNTSAVLVPKFLGQL